MTTEIWDFWAKRYNKLWVQKYSLRPTREYLLKLNLQGSNIKILDLGCGPGQLIEELHKKDQSYRITGLDFSEKMLKLSKEKNPKASHIKMDVIDLNKIDEKFNIIFCTHSMPYYKETEKVIKDLNQLLLDNGRVYLAFASGNNVYDKFVLGFVKLTTGKAYYPSDTEFKELVKPYFIVEHLEIIKERFFMPRIAIYTLKKVKI